MSTRYLVIFLISIGAQCPAQIKGKVLDALTMLPIVHARILFCESHIALASTDSIGYFEVSNWNVGSRLSFNHEFYRSECKLAYDSIPMEILLYHCCENVSEAREMFLNYCRKHIRYPAKLRRMKIGGEVLVRFSMDKSMSISNVTILKDIEGLYVGTAKEFLMSLPIEAKQMLLYFNTSEFVLPMYFTFDERPQYTAPAYNQAVVLEPVIFQVFNIRSIE